MRITGFIWFDEVVEKIESKHNVSATEVEDVIDNKPNFKKIQKGHIKGEDVYRALGRTRSGRYLTIFFVYKFSQEALVLSARDMDNKERKQYAKK